jgi:glycosyltransferase involved in cell wall biosynthesis
MGGIISTLPLVSICVPTWNSATYLRSSLDSILAQDYRNLEVIISDNASQDDTVTILREYERDGRVRLNLNDRNIGAGPNFNRLIGLAKGEFVAIYHSDDVYKPDIVSASVELLQRSPDVGLVGTMAHVVNQDGKQRYDYRLPERLRRLGRTVFTFDEAMLGTMDLAGDRIFLVTPSVMVRRTVYAELGLFDQASYGAAVDYELWLRIATRYRIAVIDRPLMSYRVHGKQGSQHEVRTNIRLPDAVRVIGAYRERLTDPAVIRACSSYLARTIIKTALKQNYAQCFVDSSKTLDALQGIAYRAAALLIRFANLFGISLGIRPGKRDAV